MSYVKKYDVGQINLDILYASKLDEPPFAPYTHELPLLSLGDVQHNLDLSLVFNYERYREEKPTGKNPFFLAPGFKLNLQKCLIFNPDGVLSAYQREDGRIIDLKAFGNTYTFDDDSQRILRKTQSTFTVEHSDFSKEIYNPEGRITAVYDKYGDDAILSYHYNSSGQLTSVTFGGTKEITFGYVSGRLDSVTYNGKTTGFVYKSGGMIDYIQHYTGVKYTFTLSKPSFSAYEVDFACEASATENGTAVSYSKKLELDNNNQGKRINVIDKIGSTAVNTVSYLYPRTFMLEAPPFKYVDVIDNNGVVTRVQIENRKVLCTYELPTGEPQFELKSPDANSRYSGNVTLYNGTVASLNNRDSGTQTTHDGMPMNYYTYANSHCWSREIVSTTERKGYYTISGWIKSNVDYVYSETVYIGNTEATNHSYEIYLEPNKKWHYFSITVYIEANKVYLRTAETTGNVSLRDVRLTYQRPDDLSKGNLYNTSLSDYVLLNGSEEIAFNEAKFYYSTDHANYELKSDEETSRVVTFSDMMKYKLRKKRDGVSDEVYYNNCKDVITGITDFKVLLHEGDTEYHSIDTLNVGIRVYAKGRKSLTAIRLNESSPSGNVVRTCTVTTNTGAQVLSTETLDANLDVIGSTVDNVTTQYVRNAQGLVTRESVSGIYRYDTIYTDTLITVKEVNPATGAVISATQYHIDPTWGGVVKVVMPDGSVITDTYDDDMSALTNRMFGTSSARQHGFDYAKGRLSSVTGGTINYGFEYAANTGDISDISKNGTVVENHTYSINNGETTVNSYYPSSDSALYTETKVLDKYGRLKGIDGVLENSYDLDPYWYYFDSSNQTHTTMESYNRATHGALSQVTKGTDGKDALLSQTSDALAGEVTKYGYDNGKLTAAVTSDTANNLRRQQTFVYDDADRLTRIRFDHNPATNEYVTSDIAYVKTASDPNVDHRVSNYSYKVDGTEKAKTVNTYDTYRRLKKKNYTVDGKVFTKSIEYDMAKVSRLIDSAGGTTRFEYDAMGRISKEKDDSGNILKSYTYDSYGQLIREDNAELDKTFVFGYDNNGNMESKKTYRYTTDSLGTVVSQQDFHYSAAHPDRLIKCDSTSIGYDAAGCPTTCNGYTVSWTRGKLSNLTYGSLRVGLSSYVYTYNAFGQRIETNYRYITKPGSTTAVVMGMVTASTQVFRYDRFGRLIYERETSQYYNEGSGTKKTIYLYDESGIIGMLHTSESGTTTAYYFARNLLGDVIGIYDTSGTKVGAYAYDAFGNCEITLDTDGIASRNPIRYRGYYYDKVTGTYDLNARYYSPEWHRFISPDDTSYLDPESANGLNLYAYCGNDPINYIDPSGHSAFLVAMSILAFAGLITTGIGVATDNNLVTAIGLTSVAIPALISGGLAISLLTPVGLGVGITTTTAGAGTVLFASAEYQEAFSHNNWILDAGMSEGWYNGLMLATATIATLGTMASSVAYSLNMNTISEVGKIRGVRAKEGYPGIRFTEKSGAIRSIEIHSAHQGHGIHLQLNNWWLNKQGYVGQYYRAFSKHFEIFKFWKGWF